VSLVSLHTDKARKPNANWNGNQEELPACDKRLKVQVLFSTAKTKAVIFVTSF